MFDYLYGLIGLGGVSVGVLGWFMGLPALLGIFSNVLSIVSPFLRSFSELVVWYAKELIDGAKTMLSNSSTFVVLLTVALIAGVYGNSIVTCEAAKERTSVEKIKPVPKNTTSKWDNLW